MATNRQAAQALCLKIIDHLVPGGENKKLYETKFAAMNDQQFAEFIADLKSGKTNLVIVVPNGGNIKLDIDRNLNVAQELGVKVFQRVWMPPLNGARSYLTPNPYLIIPLPLRRQAQHLSKKISLPVDNNSVDSITGQPTGKSQGAKISLPEVKVLAAMSMDQTLVEMLKYRGGDEGARRAMDTALQKTGKVSLSWVQPYATGVKSTKAMSVYLKACHYRSTLDQ
jgi:hypothetical protein